MAPPTVPRGPLDIGAGLGYISFYEMFGERNNSPKRPDEEQAAGAAQIARLVIPLSRALHGAAGTGTLPERSAVTPRQLEALWALDDAGPLPVGQLGRRLGLAASTATELAGRLVEAGWVERGEGPRDRRRHLLKVTAAGRREARAGRRIVERAMERRLAGLSAAEREEVRAAFATIIRVLGARPEGGGKE